jgi:zinc protease
MKRIISPAFAFAAFSILGVSAWAQDNFPTTPPPDLPSRPVTLPNIVTNTLPNGLKLVVVESHRVPLVTMRLAIRAGRITDPADQPGLAAAAASQLNAGTDKYTSAQISAIAEGLGGSVGAGAGEDFVTLTASALSENLGAITNLLGDVLLHPAFPPQELEIYKNLQQQTLTFQRQSPVFLAQEQFNKVVYNNHPYGAPTVTPAQVRALTQDKLKAFYQQHYSPAGAVMIVVGDVKASQVLGAITRALSSWKNGATSNTHSLEQPTIAEKRTIYLINRPGSVQSNILLGNLGIKRGDPEAFALTVANTILGGGISNRLFLNVREKNGYAYDVHSSVSALGLAGDFNEGSQTRTAVTAAALKEMFKESERMRTEPVGDKELEDAKNFITGNFVNSLTSQNGIADRLLQREVYSLPADYLITYRDKIKAVTAADIQRVAQKYILPDRFAVVVVGDADKLRTDLQPLGELIEVK